MRDLPSGLGRGSTPWRSHLAAPIIPTSAACEQTEGKSAEPEIDAIHSDGEIPVAYAVIASILRKIAENLKPCTSKHLMLSLAHVISMPDGPVNEIVNFLKQLGIHVASSPYGHWPTIKGHSLEKVMYAFFTSEFPRYRDFDFVCLKKVKGSGDLRRIIINPALVRYVRGDPQHSDILGDRCVGDLASQLRRVIAIDDDDELRINLIRHFTLDESVRFDIELIGKTWKKYGSASTREEAAEHYNNLDMNLKILENIRLRVCEKGNHTPRAFWRSKLIALTYRAAASLSRADIKSYQSNYGLINELRRSAKAYPEMESDIDHAQKILKAAEEGNPASLEEFSKLGVDWIKDVCQGLLHISTSDLARHNAQPGRKPVSKRLFKILSEPSKISILELLSSSSESFEPNVISKRCGMTPSNTSQHLGALVAAKFVRCELYRVKPRYRIDDAMREVLNKCNEAELNYTIQLAYAQVEALAEKLMDAHQTFTNDDVENLRMKLKFFEDHTMQALLHEAQREKIQIWNKLLLAMTSVAHM
jgi:DNA-binding transcriptional ArsR family regulator